MARHLTPLGRSRTDIGRRAAGADPFFALRDEINDLFEGFFSPARSEERGLAFVPSVDVSESDGTIHVRAELPGVDEKDIDVSVVEDVLTVRGEKKDETEEKKEHYHFVERSWGEFRRSIPLPTAVDPDKAKATFKGGVLEIELPKAPQAAKERHIAVTAK